MGLGALYSPSAAAINSPTNLVVATGDRSVVLHWDPVIDPTLTGYKVYRSTTSAAGPFTLVTSTGLAFPGYCDITGSAVNGHTNFYYATALANSQESAPSAIVPATPQTFASTNALLSYVQQTCFDYFWYLANPANGLVPDRSETSSACSIAAIGFGLTAIGIGIDHGWVSRTAGANRVLTTLDTFLLGPQGPGTSGVIGYNGWFYHFLTMNGAVRASGSELSSIDTCLLLGGVLYAKQYFNQTNTTENAIRNAADAIFDGVNWNWMSRNSSGVSMAWYPETGFSPNNWVGYNEGMIIYILGLGTATNPLPASAWNYWTSGYLWQTNYGQSYVAIPPLFTYEYSHCWIDFRHVADPYMTNRNMSYFVNSRRAALAQVAYSIANPNGWPGYSTNVWGLTASDDPTNGYAVHGLPPAGYDNGTIAPTAAGGATPFTPEYSVPTLVNFYSRYRPFLWTSFSYRDAFNAQAGWYDADELGIDQGPIIIMIENYLTQRPWKLFMQNAEVQRGLSRAGFVSLPTVTLGAQFQSAQNSVNLSWNSQPGAAYQVEYSPDLQTWLIPQTGYVTASGSTANWTDTGPPGTSAPPFTDPQRYYRVFRFGSP
jgi:hypothetical protein